MIAGLSWKFDCNYHLGRNNMSNSPPTSRFWFPEYLITVSPFRSDVITAISVYILCLHPLKICLKQEQSGQKYTFLLECYDKKINFLLLYYLESNHRSKNSTFLIESSLFTAYLKQQWFKINMFLNCYFFSPTLHCWAAQKNLALPSLLSLSPVKCPCFICWGHFLTYFYICSCHIKFPLHSVYTSTGWFFLM